MIETGFSRRDALRGAVVAAGAAALGPRAWAQGTRGLVKLSGARHWLALLSDGSVWGFGRHDEGQLGPGLPRPAQAGQEAGPVAIALPGPAIDVIAGYTASLVLLADGRVLSFGTGVLTGRVDPQDYTPRPAPAAIAGLPPIARIEGGGDNGFALSRDGRVFAWGPRGSGVLGDGLRPKVWGVPGPPAPRPGLVPGLRGVMQLSANAGHALALLADGAVMSWGNNRDGQLGRGPVDEIPLDTPAPVEGLPPVAAIAAGANASFAVLRDGRVMAWGNNGQGLLANGNRDQNERQAAPTAIAGLANVAEVRCGITSTCFARLRDGTLRAWGNDQLGQLGAKAEPSGYLLRPAAVPVGKVADVWPAGQLTVYVAPGGALKGSGSTKVWPFTATTRAPAAIAPPW